MITLREEDLAPIEDRLAALPGVTLVPQTRLLTTERDLASPVWSGLAELWQEGQDASAGWVIRRVATDGTTSQVAGEAGPEAPDLTSTIDLDLQRRAEEVLAGFDTPAVIVGIEPRRARSVRWRRTTRPTPRGDRRDRPLPAGVDVQGGDHGGGARCRARRTRHRAAVPGRRSIGSRTIPNDENFDLGPVPLHTAFAFSCNTTMGRLALDLPPDALRATAERFGLGIDYVTPGLVTVTGDVPVADTDAARVEAAIGQGQVTASPFGMALVAASVANGRTPVPAIVEGQPATADRDAEPMPENVLAALREMMRETVIEGTAGTLRDIPDLAGKTGTAEYGDNVGAHGWFIGSQDNLAFAVFVSGADGSAPAVEAAGRWLRG